MYPRHFYDVMRQARVDYENATLRFRSGLTKHGLPSHPYNPEARVREICATVKGMHDQIDALSEDFRGMEEPDLSHEPPTDPYVPIPWGTRFFRRSDIERGPTPLPTDAADAAERLQSRRRRLRR